MRLAYILRDNYIMSTNTLSQNANAKRPWTALFTVQVAIAVTLGALAVLKIIMFVLIPSGDSQYEVKRVSSEAEHHAFANERTGANATTFSTDKSASDHKTASATDNETMTTVMPITMSARERLVITDLLKESFRVTGINLTQDFKYGLKRARINSPSDPEYFFCDKDEFVRLMKFTPQDLRSRTAYLDLMKNIQNSRAQYCSN
jgi:hypothetical protein